MPRPGFVPLLAGASLLAALLLSGCTNSQADAAAGAMGPPPVSVALVQKRQVQEFDDVSARLEAVQWVGIRARVPGTLDKVHFTDGQVVKAGDMLFTIDPRPYAAEVARAQAQLTGARTQADLARAELVRAEKLVSIKAVSAQEIDQLRAAQRNSAASVQVAQAALNAAQLNLGFTQIRAPIGGRISRTAVTAGNLIAAAGDPLTTIASTDRVYAYFDASESAYLRYVSSTRDAGNAPPVRLGLSNEPGFPHEGRLDFIDNRLDPATGSIRGRAVFDNADGRFTPGLSARLRLQGGKGYDALLVPDRAISTDQTRKIVYVVGADNVVQPREVKAGALFEGMRAVTGLNEGDHIIVDGVQRAMPGAPVTPQLVQLDARGTPVAQAPAQPPAAPARKD